MPRALEVFGRRLLVEHHAEGWRVYEPGADGKRRPAPDIRVPAFVQSEADFIAYLADLLHERATPERDAVRWCD